MTDYIVPEGLPEHLRHVEHVERIHAQDWAVIRHKELNVYRGSWKKRGGRGAFHVTARKWDALEAVVGKFKDDVFEGMAAADGDGSLIEQVRDLRRYLTLWEAEHMRQQSLRVRDGLKQPGDAPPEAEKPAPAAPAAPPELPSRTWERPPLIVARVPMVYSDCYSLYGREGAYVMRTTLNYHLWKGMPNEMRKHYIEPVHEGAYAVLGAPALDEIRMAFGGAYDPQS